jgi:signal transduction histidine kinase
VIQYLRHELFHGVVAKLVDDNNAWVRQTAEKALARRTEMTRTDALKAQHGDLLRDWLTELEGLHGDPARRAALRIGLKYTGLLVREAYHEIVKVVSPLDASLTNLHEVVHRPNVDRDACDEHILRAQSRLKLLMAVLDSLRDITNEVTPEFRGENLRSIVDEAVGLVWDARRDEAKRIQLDIDIHRGLTLDAHRHRLVQALNNVLQNAVDALDGTPEPRINIDARLDDAEATVVMTIADNGCGMSDEATGDAFRLFTTKKPNGTGFGLPLAQKVIQSEHRGSIRLTSKKGSGTTVTIALPLEQGEAE